ncbi:MAG TPA: phage holin family protein [Allosphingosinicella sp.]
MAPREGNDETSIGDLFGRLAEDGRAFVRAEAGVYKAIAARRAGKARNGAIAVAIAFLLGLGAVVTLLVMAAIALALHVGPLLAGLIVAAAASILAFLLVRYGAERLKALGGDAEEKAALAAAERKP